MLLGNDGDFYTLTVNENENVINIGFSACLTDILILKLYFKDDL